jgi:hypothetical protein
MTVPRGWSIIFQLVPLAKTSGPLILALLDRQKRNLDFFLMIFLSVVCEFTSRKSRRAQAVLDSMCLFFKQSFALP